MTTTEQKQQEFDRRLAELRRRFHRIRRTRRLIWLGYYVISGAVGAVLLLPDRYPYLIFGLLVNLLVSVSFLSYHLKQWRKRQDEQERELMEQAPVGQIRWQE